MRLTIDRFEGDFCVCEYEEGKTLDIPRTLVPKQAHEGDVLKITIDTIETEARKKYAEDLRKKLFKKE